MNHPISKIIEIDETRSKKKKNEHQYSNFAYKAKHISVRNKNTESEVREYHILSTTIGRQINLISSPKRA